MNNDNRSLTKLIKLMKVETSQATTLDELLNVVTKAIHYDGEIRYRRGTFYTVMILLFAAFASGVIIIYLGRALPPYSLLIYFVLLILTVIVLGEVFCQENSIDSLSSDLFFKSLKIANGIEDHVLKPGEVHDLGTTFSEFQRGNYSRHFAQEWRVKSSEQSRPALYYRFHYVDQYTRVVSEPDGKGGVRTRTVTEFTHYDRYGLVFDFPYALGLSINSSGKTLNPVSYKPAYSEFCERFTIGANSELEAAKFLKPALVEQVVNLSHYFTRLNIQISNQGQMLIAFSEPMLSECKQQYSLREPQLFYQELQQNSVIENLKAANELLDVFTHYLDNNFQEEPQL